MHSLPAKRGVTSTASHDTTCQVRATQSIKCCACSVFDSQVSRVAGPSLMVRLNMLASLLADDTLLTIETVQANACSL